MEKLKVHPVEQTVYDRKETFITAGITVIGSARKLEDAEFIVRAVNSHQELLSLLKETLDYGKTEKGWEIYKSLVKKAIAKAEGK